MLKRTHNISKPKTPKYYNMCHLHNLIQYFYVIGLDNQITSKMSFYKNYNINLKPKITTKYPNIDLPYLNIPNEIIISHCFPNGYKLIEKNADNVSKNEYFFFTIKNPNPLEENNNFRHQIIHFSCLLMYEDIINYYKIFSIKNSEYINDFLLSSYYVPKVICICSFYPFYLEYIKILESLRQYIIDNFDNGIEFPIENYIDSLIFKIPSPPKGIFSINVEFLNLKLNFEQKAPNEIPLPEIDLFFLFQYFTVEKLLLILKYILFEYPIFIFHQNKFELSNIVEGLVSLIFPFEYQFPVIPILPIENFSLIRYIKSFVIGINGKYYDKYFEDNKIEIADKTVIVINLLNDKKSKKDIIEIIPNIKKPEIFLQQVSFFEKYYEYDNQNEIALPEHYTEKVIKRIRQYFFEIKNCSVKKNEFNEKVRKIFFYYFVSLFVDYQKFIVRSENISQILFDKYLSGKLELEDIFNIKKYLENISKIDIPFYSFLLKTELFKSFIFKKVFPLTTQDKLDILFFDENVNKKLNKNLFSKSISTPFLDMKFEKNIINIKIEDKPFYKEEIIYLSYKKKKKKALDYNQLITDNSYYLNDDRSENESNKFLNQFINVPTFKIKYYGFPNLLFDENFFKKNNENIIDGFSLDKDNDPNQIYKMNPGKLFITYESLCENIINNETIKKNYEIYNYSFNKSNNLRPNMRNYILLLWLKYFSLSFWYIIPSERKIKFKEMLKILYSCTFIEENIYILLYNVILSYGDMNMIIEYFQFMKNKSYICYLLMKNKFSIELKKKKILNNKEINEKKENINLRRSLSIFNNNNEKDKIIFETKINCQTCNKEIDLLNLSTNFSKMDFNTKKLLINCLCGNTFFGSMNVKVVSSSGNIYYEKFNLCSPYYLYNLNWEKSNNKINISTFFIDYPERFWNAIWYFSLQYLPCDFLIPYKKNNLFEIQKTGNIYLNKNNFDLYKIKSKSNWEMKNNNKKFGFNLDIPISKINIEISKTNRKERKKMKKRSEYKTIKRKHLNSVDIKDCHYTNNLNQINNNNFNIKNNLNLLKLDCEIDIKDIKDIYLNDLNYENHFEK